MGNIQEVVPINSGKSAQLFADRDWWRELEVVGWKLYSFSCRKHAEFYTLRDENQKWGALQYVTAKMRDDILVNTGKGKNKGKD